MWSDQETTGDCLGFETYVESLASACLAKDRMVFPMPVHMVAQHRKLTIDAESKLGFIRA